MNDTEPGRWALWLSFPLAVLLAVAAVGGLYLPSTYANETRIYAAQLAGADASNLVVVVPVLVITAILALRGSVAARLVWMGTLVCVVYNFVYYTLAVHFNGLFLVYCGVLGLSSYALAGILPSLPIPEIARRFGPRAPAKTTASVLGLMSLALVSHNLSEIVPAMLAGRAPQAVRGASFSAQSC